MTRTSHTAVFALVLAAGSASAQQIFWAAPVSGNFTEATKWTGGMVPLIANDATINAVGTNSYTVTVQPGVPRQINRLIVNGDASTTFTIRPGGAVYVFDPVNTIFNTGLIRIGETDAPSTATAKLSIATQNGRINGSGTILLQGYPDDSTARLDTLFDGNPNSIIISANQTVRGAGQIAGGTDWVNQGTIRSDLTDGTIVIFGSPLNNSGGLIRAATGGILDIRATVLNDAGGRIYCDAFSRITFSTQHGVTGGEIDASSGGSVEYRGLNTLDSVWLKGTHTLTNSYPDLTFANSAGTLRLDGTFVFNLRNGGLPPFCLVKFLGGSQPFDLAGTGTLRFAVPADMLLATNSEMGFTDAASTQFIRLPGHNLEGNIRINSSVRIGRTLSPGLAAPDRIGDMRFYRTLRMNDNSEVLIDVQGETPNLRDNLQAAGDNAALVLDNNVTLRLRIGGGYVPADGDIQTVINLAGTTVSPAITGTFANVQVENAPPGVTAELVYTASAVRVRWSVAACDDIDFNNNTVFPEDQDVIDFFNVLAGGECASCNDIDFNNNTVFPEDQDVIDFFTVLAGGDCS